jgi:transposase
MLAITPQHQLFLYFEPLDFRKGIDGIVGVCLKKYEQDPFAGGIFIFRNKRGTALKLLCYDGTGFWLCHKRFSQGKLTWWPATVFEAKRMSAVELTVLINQGKPAQLTDSWYKVSSSFGVSRSL